MVLRENSDGTSTVVGKSLVDDGWVYALLPANSVIRVTEDPRAYSDVLPGAWYRGPVEFVSNHGLFQGVEESVFAPNKPMTRAVLAVVLCRLEEGTASGESPFEDVPDGKWFTQPILWAYTSGLLLGTNEGFKPYDSVTREQLAVLLFRYSRYLGLDYLEREPLDRFPDYNETAGWAKEGMQWAVSTGLFQGYDDGTLRPKGVATRAQAASLLARLISGMVK